MSSILMISPVELAALTALGVSFAIAVIAIHRLYFHAFSKVPGPFLARITSAYSAYHSWRGTMHLDIQRCHQKYGDLIRYAPNQVLTLHSPDMDAIYAHGKPFRKSKGYGTMIPIPDGWSTMTSIDKELHRNLRRVFRSGVTAESLARYEPAVLRNLEIYFSELTKVRGSDGWSVAADMRRWNLCLGFDTMADIGLGLKTNLLQSRDREFVFPALHVHEKKMGLWEQLPVLDRIGLGMVTSLAFYLTSPKARSFASWYRGFLLEAIANNTHESQGIFSPVIQSGQGTLEKPGHNYSQMIGEGAFSTFSSADGYGMMFSGFVHYLSRYPHVYERLAAEMRSLFAPGERIVWGPKLESSAYLRAVIDEVMRLLPPACGVHWREAERPGVIIGGSGKEEALSLPVGSDVGMSLFSVFRDGRIFRDPVKFWPERWIQGTLPKEELAHAKKMFTPFLIGPRNCAGGHVAIMIASIAYAHTLVNYDFRLGPQEQENTNPSGNLWSNAGPEEPGVSDELIFESHYSIAGWDGGPFIQFKGRVVA